MAGPLRKFRYSPEWEGLTELERHHRAQEVDPRFAGLRPDDQQRVWKLIEEKGAPEPEPTWGERIGEFAAGAGGFLREHAAGDVGRVAKGAGKWALGQLDPRPDPLVDRAGMFDSPVDLAALEGQPDQPGGYVHRMPVENLPPDLRAALPQPGAPAAPMPRPPAPRPAGPGAPPIAAAAPSAAPQPPAEPGFMARTMGALAGVQRGQTEAAGRFSERAVEAGLPTTGPQARAAGRGFLESFLNIAELPEDVADWALRKAGIAELDAWPVGQLKKHLHEAVPVTTDAEKRSEEAGKWGGYGVQIGAGLMKLAQHLVKNPDKVIGNRYARAFLEPYLKNPAKMLGYDLAAGGASGFAMEAAEQALPEDLDPTLRTVALTSAGIAAPLGVVGVAAPFEAMSSALRRRPPVRPQRTAELMELDKAAELARYAELEPQPPAAAEPPAPAPTPTEPTPAPPPRVPEEPPPTVRPAEEPPPGRTIPAEEPPPPPPGKGEPFTAAHKAAAEAVDPPALGRQAAEGMGEVEGDFTWTDPRGYGVWSWSLRDNLPGAPGAPPTPKLKGRDVTVGETYGAKVSGKNTKVRITAKLTNSKGRTYWMAVNEATGKTVRINSVQRLKGKPPQLFKANEASPRGQTRSSGKWGTREDAVEWIRKQVESTASIAREQTLTGEARPGAAKLRARVPKTTEDLETAVQHAQADVGRVGAGHVPESEYGPAGTWRVLESDGRWSIERSWGGERETLVGIRGTRFQSQAEATNFAAADIRSRYVDGVDLNGNPLGEVTPPPAAAAPEPEPAPVPKAEPEAPPAEVEIPPEVVTPEQRTTWREREIAADTTSENLGGRVNSSLGRALTEDEDLVLSLLKANDGDYSGPMEKPLQQAGEDFLELMLSNPKKFPTRLRTQAQDLLRQVGDLELPPAKLPRHTTVPDPAKTVAVARSLDETRYNINHLYVDEGGTLVATDGHRLHLVEGQTAYEPGWYRYDQTGKKWRRFTDDELAREPMEYPNYRQIVQPDHPDPLTLGPDQAGDLEAGLAAAFKRYGGKKTGVRANLPLSEEHMNARYLLDTLKAARAHSQSGAVEYHPSLEAGSPIKITSTNAAGEKFSGIVMPMRTGAQPGQRAIPEFAVNWGRYTGLETPSGFTREQMEAIAAQAQQTADEFYTREGIASLFTKGGKLRKNLSKEKKRLYTQYEGYRGRANRLAEQLTDKHTNDVKRTKGDQAIVSRHGPGTERQYPARPINEGLTDPSAPALLDQYARGEFNPGPSYVPFTQSGLIDADLPLPAKLVSRSKILHSLAKALQIAVSEGPLRKLGLPAGTDGFFRPSTGALAVRKWGDIQAATHEIMHALADRYPTLFAMTTEPNPTILNEIRSVSYDVDSAEEGLAELFRLWMTHSRSRGRLGRGGAGPPDRGGFDVAPNAMPELEKRLADVLPDKHWKALQAARKEMHDYMIAGAQHAIAEGHSPLARDPASVVWNAGDSMREAFFDEFHALLKLDRRVGGGDLADHAWETARRSRGIPNIINALVEFGVPSLRADGTIRINVKPLREILRPIVDSSLFPDQAFKKFWVYTDARMSKEMLGQGREKLYAMADVDSVLRNTTGETKRLYDGVFDDLVKFNNAVADFGQEMGLFSAGQRAKWRRKEYAMGLYRQMAHQGAVGGQRRFPAVFDWLTSITSGRMGGKALPGVMQGHPGVYTARGSARYLKNPWERIMEGPARIIQLAIENDVKRKVGTQLRKPGGGAFGRDIDPASKRLLLDKKRVLDELQTQMRDVVNEATGERWTTQELDELFGPLVDASEEVEMLSLYFGGQRPWGKNVMTYLENGRARHMLLNEPLADAMMALRKTPVDGFTALLQGFKNFYRSAITLTPDFWYANTVARDPWMATIRTQKGMQHFSSSARGLAEAARKGPLYNEMMMNGMGGAGLINSPTELQRQVVRYAQIKGLNPMTILKNPTDIFRALAGIRAFAPTPRNLLRGLESIGQKGELAARLGEAGKITSYWQPGQLGKGYSQTELSKMVQRNVAKAERLQRRGVYPTLEEAKRAVQGPTTMREANSWATRQGSSTHAAFAGRDVSVDFSAMGADPRVRFFAHTAPFFNAMMQGGDNLYRAVGREQRAGPAVKFGLYAMATMGLYALNHDKAWYKRLPLWDRIGYHHWSFGEEDADGNPEIHLRQPRLFDVGFTSAALEIGIDNMLRDPKDRGFGTEIIQAIAQNYSLPVPGGALTEIPVELLSDKDWFTGRPIEGRYLEQLPKWQRYRSRTPEWAKSLGKWQMEKGLGEGGEGILSPVQADAIFQSLFQTFSWYAMMAGEGMSEKGRAFHYDDWPIARRVVERPGRYNKVRDDFMQFVGELNRLRNGMRRAEDELDWETVERYEQEYDPDLHYMMRGYDLEQRDLKKEMDELRNATWLTKEQRRDQMDALQRQRDRIMEEGMGEAQQMRLFQ